MNELFAFTEGAADGKNTVSNPDRDAGDADTAQCAQRAVGLEIVKRGISEGSVYVLLSRLEEKGLVDVTRVQSEYRGLTRSHYKINKDGQRVLLVGEFPLGMAVRA